MKAKDLIACQVKCFCFFYKSFFSQMLRLIVGLTADSEPSNLTILALSKRQLRKLANKVRTVKKTSYKIENTLYESFPSAFLNYGIQ